MSDTATTSQPAHGDSKNGNTTIVTETDDDTDTLKPCLGLCCIIISFVTNLRACIGCVSESILCCFSMKHVLFKPATRAGSYCTLCMSDCEMNAFTVCLSSQNRCCCVDIRASIPPNEKVPCLITLFYWTICYKCGIKCKCCANIAEIKV